MPSKLHWSQVRVLPRSKRVAQLGRAVRRFQKNSLFAVPPLEIFSGSLKQAVCYEHLANHQRHRFFDHDLSVLPKQPQPQTRAGLAGTGFSRSGMRFDTERLPLRHRTFRRPHLRPSRNPRHSAWQRSGVSVRLWEHACFEAFRRPQGLCATILRPLHD